MTDRHVPPEVPFSSSSTSSLPYRDARAQPEAFVLDERSSYEYGSESVHTENFFAYNADTTAAMMPVATPANCVVPDIFTTIPPLRDALETQTSYVQEQTIHECLPYLVGQTPGLTYNDHGVPHLDRARHVKFLHNSLKQLRAPYVAMDASRPWMFYWAMAGLSTLGEDISSYQQRLISTVRPIQNATGGFGGGNGQMSHLAPTYAIILALAMIGGPEALDVVDRKTMWRWLGALKQPDGGFQMSVGGEEDVRGAYIAAVIISLFDLPLDLPRESPAWTENGATFFTNLPEWVARCQTFEGGISGKPDAEAHGAYAFCALACLCILGEPHIIMPKYLDVPRLIGWLSARQYAPEGGFAGRTNKLVDGCYSHWIGGCWPLVEACLEGPTAAQDEQHEISSPAPIDDLYSREGLIRYILCCCQDTSKRGGMRDKPSHTSDAYHTCYVLAGLSSAQHKWHFHADTPVTKGGQHQQLGAAYQWTVRPVLRDAAIFDESDRVGTSHPVFVVPEGVAERTRAHFTTKGGF